jgi:hypothetical protein
MWTAPNAYKGKPERNSGSFSDVYMHGDIAVKVGPLRDPTLIYLRWCHAVQRGELPNIRYEHGPEIYAIVPSKTHYRCVMKRYRLSAAHKVPPMKELYRVLKPFTDWLETQGYVMGGRLWERSWQRALVANKEEKYKESDTTFRTDLHNGNYKWDNDWNLIIVDPLAGQPQYRELALFK